MAYIDFHAHLPSTDGASEKLLAMMKALNIERAIVVAGGTLSPLKISEQIARGGFQDVSVDNAALKSVCDKTESRLLPFYFANPHRSSDEYQRLGIDFFGLKLGPAIHGLPFDDVRLTPFLELALQFRHPVYLHCLARPGFDIAAFVCLAKKFPKLNFVLGHAGIGNFDLYAVSQIESLANIFFETSGGFSFVVKTAMQTLGKERVLFGTEYPLQHPRVEIEKALCLGLSDEEFNHYTRQNAARLIGGFYA